MTTHDANLKFAYMPGYRTSNTELILHHTAVPPIATVEQVHTAHLANGWAGIGYHYYVRKNGTVWRGRLEDWIGGHTEGHGNAIGVCFEGNFENELMSAAQLSSGIELVRDILSRHPGMKVYKHRDFNATACPGKNFPFDKIINTDMEDDMTQEQFNAMFRTMTTEKYGDNPEQWSLTEGGTQWAKDNGIFQGDNLGNYNWQMPITREALAAVLYRYDKQRTPSTPSTPSAPT